MTVNARARIRNALLAAFADSEISNDELRWLAIEVLRDPKFLRELDLLRKHSHYLSRDKTKKRIVKKRYSELHEQPANVRDAAYLAIKRRRLSKATVLALMESVVHNIRGRDLSPTMNMRSLVKNFFAGALPNEAKAFLNLVDPRPDEDAFLKGIIRRNREA